MNKNEEKERKSSKGPSKDGKLRKTNKPKGNDNKLPPNEKGGKPDDVSNKFPNFSRLTTEERLVFFQALNAAKRNVQERGVPTRERFGTVHDEYLQHSQKEGESEVESVTEKASSSFLSLSSFSQPSSCSFRSDTFEEVSSIIGEASLSSEPSLPDPYEAIIRQDADSIVDLFLEKKRRNASKWSARWKEKRERTEEGKTVEESAWPFLMSGPKTTDTPLFDALNPEEKTIFFRILEEARNKVLEKNLEKKEILPLNSIMRMYQGHRLASRICIPKEKPKSLRVKVTLTSGDNQRIEMLQREKLEMSEPATEVKRIEKKKSLEVLPRDEALPEVQKEEPKKTEEDQLIPSEPTGSNSIDNIDKCEDSVESIASKPAGNKETSLKKETPMTVSTTEVKEDIEEEKLEKTPTDDKIKSKKNVQLEDTSMNAVTYAVKSETKNEIDLKEEPKEPTEGETSGTSFASQDEKESFLVESSSRAKTEEEKDDGQNSSENTEGKVELEESSEGEKIIGLSLHEEESASEKDQEKEEECHLMQACGDEEDPTKSEEECLEKELTTHEEKEEIGREECEECEESEREEVDAKKCESPWEGNTETVERMEEVVIARKICESLVALLGKEERGECEENEEMEPKEEAKIEEDAAEGFPSPRLWDQATTSTKVMIVEDNVIEKIRKLIYYLEGKVRKDGRSEKEYLQLLVDYVDYLSKILQTLVHKKECQIQMQSAFTTATARLKFDDGAGTTADSSIPRKFVPRSVSAQALGADALLAVSQENVRADSKKSPDAVFASDSEISLSLEEEGEDVHFLPPTIGSKKVISTKIRLLQDLLRQRAEFAEGSTEDFKIVYRPKEEYVPPAKPPTVQLIKEDNEESARQEHHFFRALARCFTCGKKKDEEDGIYENLKGEVVRVDVSDKKRDPANATLNQSTMEVLKAAGRKKVIEKYYSGE